MFDVSAADRVGSYGASERLLLGRVGRHAPAARAQPEQQSSACDLL